ncbi:MAG: hypothetical protein ACLQLG_19090 [Thermoguttaceae bacterium]
MKKKKYLIETSAVLVAMGGSTADHRDEFQRTVADGALFTSLYIRKEFIRRWICYLIHLAFYRDQFGNLADAMDHANEAFSIRDVKTLNHFTTWYMRECGALTSRSGAKEIARLAVIMLQKFDRLFRSRTGNSCGCVIGGRALKVDFNVLFDTLGAFVKSFKFDGTCPVNKFLGLQNAGHGDRLLKDDAVRTQTEAGRNLEKIRAKKTTIDCFQCGKIGDAVVVLDQPGYSCLVHIDSDFDLLCPAAGRRHTLLASERAVARDRTAERGENRGGGASAHGR